MIIDNEIILNAKRWEALMSCQRIGVLGSAGLGTERQHIGLELWTHYPNITAEAQDNAKTILTNFIDNQILNSHLNVTHTSN